MIVSKSIVDMLCCCILDLGGNWDDHLPLVEFTYNNSYQANIGMAPYEALYERSYRLSLCWVEPDELVAMGPLFIVETTEKIWALPDRLKTVQSRQKSYADLNQKEVEYDVGDFVFLKVFPIRWVTRFGIKGKLAPRHSWVMSIMYSTYPCLRSTRVIHHIYFPMQTSHFRVTSLTRSVHQRFWVERFACLITRKLPWSRSIRRSIPKKRPHGNWNIRYMKSTLIYFDVLCMIACIQISKTKFLKRERM